MLKCLKSLLAALIILTTLNVVAAPDPDVIKILVDDNYPPYTFVEDGSVKGTYVDIIRKAVRQIQGKYTVEIVGIPWKRGLKLIESGHELAIAPPYQHYKSRPYID